MSPAFPSLFDGQAVTWPDPFSVQVVTTEDVAYLAGHEATPDQGQREASLLELKRKLVVSAWLVWKATGTLPVEGDRMYLPDVFGEDQGLRVTVVTRTWVRLGEGNVMKLILPLDLASS